jgi:hypothetical protein
MPAQKIELVARRQLQTRRLWLLQRTRTGIRCCQFTCYTITLWLTDNGHLRPECTEAQLAASANSRHSLGQGHRRR